jgi:addiction module RelB/DinJ family antitoxin
MATTLFRARVNTGRAKAAQKILDRLGLSPADAVNMLFAQIVSRRGRPFDVYSSYPEHELKLRIGAVGAAGVENEGFGGTGVDGEITGLGIAGGPAAGLEILQVELAGFLELPGIAAGENRRARRGALGVGAVGMLEQDAIAGDTVEIWRANPLRAVGAGVDAPIVGDGEKDLGWA